jgi:hypothetical protein
MIAPRLFALLATLLAACGQPAAPTPVARAEPAKAAQPAAPTGSEPNQSSPDARPDEALCTRFAEHVSAVMAREDASTKAATDSMRPEMVKRCVARSTVGEITCGLAANSSADMEKCKR